MTRFAAMGYAVLALDDETIGSSDLQQGITSPAFVERVRWGCALAKVARNLDGMDPDRIFAWGEGLGGGVALAVSALDERGLACTALANPLPSGLETLSPRVRGSVLMGTSLMDTVSDPKGQFAVFNGLECDRSISSMPNTLTSASMRSKTKSSTSLTKRSIRVLWPRRPGHRQQEWRHRLPARQLRRFLWQLRNSPALSLPSLFPIPKTTSSTLPPLSAASTA